MNGALANVDESMSQEGEGNDQNKMA